MQKLTPSDDATLSGGSSLKDATRSFERRFIEDTLQHHDFNKEVVAHELGISLSSLYRKMEELKLPVKHSPATKDE
jgi:DNA-binding NtrC family response regulator